LAKQILRQDSLFCILLLFSAFGHFALGYLGSSEEITPPKVLAREQGENTVRVQLVSAVKPSVMSELPELPPQPQVVVDENDAELPQRTEQLDSQRVAKHIALPNKLANSEYRVPESQPQQRQKQDLPEDSRQIKVVQREVQPLNIPMEQAEMVLKVEPREGNAEADLVNQGTRGAIVPPQLNAENKDPAYPPALLGRKVEGRVVLLVSVLQTGRVGKIAVHTASGQKELDAAAVAAVANWRFSPGTRGGKVQEMDVLVPVTFKIVTGNRRRK
jgi:TonB family protein